MLLHEPSCSALANFSSHVEHTHHSPIGPTLLHLHQLPPHHRTVLPHRTNAIYRFSQHPHLHRGPLITIVVNHFLLGDATTKILPCAALAEGFALLLLVGGPPRRKNLSSGRFGQVLSEWLNTGRLAGVGATRRCYSLQVHVVRLSHTEGVDEEFVHVFLKGDRVGTCPDPAE